MRLPFLRDKKIMCQQMVELLSDFIEGTLPNKTHKRVAAHLAMCAACPAYVEQLRATIALTGRLREEDIEPHMMDELLDVFRTWET